MQTKLLIPLAILALALVSGCGSDDDEATQPQSGGSGPAKSPSGPPGAEARMCSSHAAEVRGLRVTGTSCAEARATVAAWQRSDACNASGGPSRGACSVGSYRCLTINAERGMAVSCARPGRSIAFLVKR